MAGIVKTSHTSCELRRSFGAPDKLGAEVVLSELHRIEQRDGGLAPRVVVEEARPDDAPLHVAFEWRDGLAADKYRLIQARNLIRAVHVIGEDGEDRGSAFVHVTIEDSRAYYSVARVVSDAVLFASALAELRSKLDGAVRAVRDLESAATTAQSSLTIVRRHTERAAMAARRVRVGSSRRRHAAKKE